MVLEVRRVHLQDPVLGSVLLGAVHARVVVASLVHEVVVVLLAQVALLLLEDALGVVAVLGQDFL